MLKKSYLTIIFAGLATTVLIGLVVLNWNAGGSDAQANDNATARTPEEIDAALDVALEVKETSAFIAAAADPRVSSYTSDAFNVDQQFFPKEITGNSSDELKLRVVGKQTVSGDWQTSQERVYSDVVDLTILLSDGVVQSVETQNVPDRREVIVFDDGQKALIKTALADDRVKALLEGKSNAYVFTLYGGTYFAAPDSKCPPGDCYVITWAQENSKAVMHAWVNVPLNEVVKVAKNAQW